MDKVLPFWGIMYPSYQHPAFMVLVCSRAMEVVMTELLRALQLDSLKIDFEAEGASCNDMM